MFDQLLAGFLKWVEATKEVKMRALDIQKEGLGMQKENAALERRERSIRLEIAKIDLASRNMAAVPLPPAAPTPLTVAPPVQDETEKDPKEGTKTLKDMNLDELKTLATNFGVKFKSNITEGTLRKKIINFQKSEAVAANSSPAPEPPDEDRDRPVETDDASLTAPEKDYSGEEVRAYCRAHMATQQQKDGDKGRAATKAFLKELTGLDNIKEMEGREGKQDFLNKIAIACIELGLTIPEKEEEEF
jgi:hypothetical protein